MAIINIEQEGAFSYKQIELGKIPSSKIVKYLFISSMPRTK